MGIGCAEPACNYLCVPTIEGSLIVKWRQAHDLTQERLGELCPNKVGPKAISRYENAESSMSVSTLLNVINGLGVPGRTPELRLVRFFLGPEAAWIDRAMEAARDSEQTAQETIRALGQLSSPERQR
jgi:transcriptional regulator with XRE-family HTH domain